MALLQICGSKGLFLCSFWVLGCQGTSSVPAESARTAPQEEPALSPADSAEPVQVDAPSPPNIPLSYPRSATPWLGVELQATGRTDAGVRVSGVFPRSPAARAGLQEGDVLLSLGGARLTTPSSVSEYVQAQRPGEQLPVLFLRNERERLARVELEGAPEFEDRVRLAFIGGKAPEISGVTTFQGQTSALAEVRGQVVVLEFWASFCGVCRYLSPILDRWHRTYHPQGAEVIGITVDPPRVGAEVAARFGMSYTLVSDGEGRASRSYWANQVPMLVLIDKRGIVRDVIVGFAAARIESFEQTLITLLGEPA